MNDYTRKRAGGFTLVQLIISGVAVTAAIMFGIRYFICGNAEDAPPPAAAADPFKAEVVRSSGTGFIYNPASRPESLGGGGSIEMFEKTNAGYAREAEAEAAAEDAPAVPEVKKATAAARSAAAKPAQKQAATVIPRLQPAKSFGIPGESGNSPASLMPKGAGSPDISSIIQNATKGAQKKH